MTSDRGGAPCAPPSRRGSIPILSLAICKPAIRRTAEPGDRIVGLTSLSLQISSNYPALAVIFLATVDEIVDARQYYAARGPFRARPDCIYKFDRQHGEFYHGGNSSLHSDPSHLRRDLGSYPFYRNGRVLLCREFRYFGASAFVIPPRLPLLCELAETQSQGHRVFTCGVHAGIDRELDSLFRTMYMFPMSFTPECVKAEKYDSTSLRVCLRNINKRFAHTR